MHKSGETQAVNPMYRKLSNVAVNKQTGGRFSVHKFQFKSSQSDAQSREYDKM
jgi:hypothetical protein